MNSYLLHFIAYTFAMLGFIVMVLFIYKKAMYAGDSCKNKNFLSVESSLKISPTKTVYVIKAGKEKFLINTEEDYENLIKACKFLLNRSQWI